MKILAIPALAAALALGACSEANAPEPTETETVVEETVVPVPETTTVVTEDDATADDGDRVTVSEDGIEADVGDADTRVRADVDRDPSLTVEGE
ncbi:hypothetical protein [Pelagerythrobacter aerophilus]|uniref:Circumsporozoite protein n=1 Tax=Pelagerythrobacter aerophilus TaxID=2306995 RepID=A0A418NCV2_9SPHN|nr:hypothetical protein [Pelagerythrobacter aerophilus]RIV75642.1 hypothetical protein D2V04_15235 [Pelagerythrobacter aerophilus]